MTQPGRTGPVRLLVVALALSVGSTTALAGPLDRLGSWLRGDPPPVSTPPMPPAPAPADPIEVPEGLTLSGTLEFDGRPLGELVPERPSFWFRHKATNTVPRPVVHYDPRTSRFEARGVPEGELYAVPSLDTQPKNGRHHPGDLYGGGTVDASRSPVNLAVWEILHMLEPQDNFHRIEGTAGSEECLAKPVHDAPVRFRFAPFQRLPPGPVQYEYQVDEVVCPYQNSRSVMTGSTREPEFQLALPPSPPGTFYLLRVGAFRGEGPLRRRVGSLMVHGRSFMGWDYRFHVSP